MKDNSLPCDDNFAQIRSVLRIKVVLLLGLTSGCEAAYVELSSDDAAENSANSLAQPNNETDLARLGKCDETKWTYNPFRDDPCEGDDQLTYLMPEICVYKDAVELRRAFRSVIETHLSKVLGDIRIYRTNNKIDEEQLVLWIMTMRKPTDRLWLDVVVEGPQRRVLKFSMKTHRTPSRTLSKFQRYQAWISRNNSLCKEDGESLGKESIPAWVDVLDKLCSQKGMPAGWTKLN